MISVVIPLYNKESSILNTINTICSQTYADFEMIIVNDGSNDRSLEVVNAIDDKRLKIIDKKNGGVCSARNAGVKAASYDYIAFIDGDDLWVPWHLQTIVDMINEYPGGEVGGYSTKFLKSEKPDINIDALACYRKKENILVDDYLKESSINDGLISSSNFAVRKECLNEVGLYDETLVYGEDLEMYYRLFRKYKLVINESLTAIYFTGAENRSTHRIIPLKKRFHKFDFENKSRYEKRYLAKLVSLIILDYSMQGAYKTAFNVFLMYRKYWYLIMRYYNRLIFRKMSKVFKPKFRRIYKDI